MEMTRNALLCLLALPCSVAIAQAPDPSAERARLGNQRIQAEVERRAKEEPAAPVPVGSVTTATPAAVDAPPAAPPPAPAPSGAAVAPIQPATTQPAPVASRQAPAPTPAPTPDSTSRALEQLRQLGQLKDAGYLTDEEFQRIKSRILQQAF